MTDDVRASARILLVDSEDRLLLFQAKTAPDAPADDVLWFTVGGGVEPGEQIAEAAARELREETGLTVAPEDLGPIVATTGGRADLGWISGLFRDDFYFLRVDTHAVDISGFQELEASTFVRFRWWTADEIAATHHRVVPFGLAALLRDLVSGVTPEQPVQLPWHH